MQTFADVTRNAEAGDPEAQELLAAVYEQGNRPTEARPWLERAASAGRMSAVGRLGLWRLVGYGGPAEPAAAVTDIFRAATAGDPDALTMAGVITAGGVGCPRDTKAALGWLAAGARAGDGRSLCQLGLLVRASGAEAEGAALIAAAEAAGFEAAAQLAPGAPQQELDYDRLAEGVDLSMFEANVPLRVESNAPRIATAPALLPGWACDYVMAMAGPVLTRGKVLDETGGESIREQRSNTVMNFGLADSDVVLELINGLLARAAGMPPENAEGLGVLHYAPGEQYAPHVDFIPPTAANQAQLAHRGQRVRTLLVSLNEEFEGGATEFMRLGIGFKPARGSALIFDNVTRDGQGDPMTLHRGAPPTRGQKWIISKWFRTKALRPAPTT